MMDTVGQEWPLSSKHGNEDDPPHHNGIGHNERRDEVGEMGEIVIVE